MKKGKKNKKGIVNKTIDVKKKQIFKKGSDENEKEASNDSCYSIFNYNCFGDNLW